MKKGRIGVLVGASALLALGASAGHAAPSPQVARGEYLVTLGGCSDCHTPGTFLGHPDMTKFLGGSDVGFEIPGLGVFPGRNLTPDKETGLGNWTAEQIVTAITKGVEPGGRVLAPVMPYRQFAHLTHSDALAIAAYLKSIAPVKNRVAGPFGPKQKATTFVFKVLPADVYNSMDKSSH